jgi:iron-sulfur cluster assembly accessory protein
VNITVTAAAERFMRRMVRFSGVAGAGFRLSVKPGGCSGLASEFSVAPSAGANDAELNVNGLRVFLDAESRVLLDGVTVDFADAIASSGLTFIDPKAASCGCSSSTSESPAVATVSLASLVRR